MATTATQKSRVSASKPETSSSRHQRKCTICHHADREEIEQMFLHWFSASAIHRRFLLRDRSSIYDHAHATGLYSRRRKNMRCALENIIERSDECPISSNGIVRAIKAYCSLTDAGEWVEPASRVVYQTVSTPSASSDPRSAGVSPALFAPVYPDAETNARTASHAKAPSTTVPGTTVDGWNCRSGDVRSTPLPSVSHITATDAPVAPQKNPPQTTAPEALATNHSSLATGHSSTLPALTQEGRDEGPLPSNRYNKLLETDATHTKQRTGPHSNRYK
ncbi:MAG: hypothetical protein ACYDCD_05330 [Candidatus Acidiferrales bacterium]